MPITTTTVYRYSQTVPVGEVISTDPPAGTVVPPDQVVTIYVSLGPFPASRFTGDFPELMQAAVEAPSHAIMLATMVFLDIPGDPTYVTDAGVNLNWDGHEWIGVGVYGSIEGPTESLDTIAQPVRLTLSGVDPGLAAAAQASDYHGRDAVVYLALMDPHTLAFIDEPEELWSGYMDVMTIDVDQNSGTIRLDCEHRLRRLPSTRRWTDEDQRARHPTDRFFQFLSEIAGYVSGGGGTSISYSGRNRRERSNPRPF